MCKWENAVLVGVKLKYFFLNFNLYDNILVSPYMNVLACVRAWVRACVRNMTNFSIVIAIFRMYRENAPGPTWCKHSAHGRQREQSWGG